MNAAKCATLTIRGIPSRTSWVCDQSRSFKLEDNFIPALSVTDTYKYLGIMM